MNGPVPAGVSHYMLYSLRVLIDRIRCFRFLIIRSEMYSLLVLSALCAVALSGIYMYIFLTCQAHPALVKRIQWSVHLFQFWVVYHQVNFVQVFNGLDDPWLVSRRCLEQRWFVRDPTSLARYKILYQSNLMYIHKPDQKLLA